MKKFLVLCKASETTFEQLKNRTPEQRKAARDAWTHWRTKAAGSIADVGSPLGESVTLGKSGAATSTPNDLGWYSILQGDSMEAVARSLAGHPHFMLPDGTIEIVELLSYPGG